MSQTILEWSKSILSITPLRWFNLVQSVPLELLSLRPAPNEWSALEVLQHMVDVETISTPVRLKALMAGQAFPAFNPADQKPKAAPNIALADEFDKLRQESLGLLNEVTEADLERQALHAEYGIVSMSQFLHHIAAHDLMHLVQAEQAMMQPLIQGCGPWVVNYDAHIAKLS
jgi:uncharacterized damage-inducible protein DinB